MKKIFKIKIIIIGLILLINLCSIQANAAGNNAVVCGLKEGNVKLTEVVNNSKKTFGELGYNSVGYINPTQNQFSGYAADNVNKLLESDIVVLTGHGTTLSIQVAPTVYLRRGHGTSNYVGTNDIQWSKCSLVMLVGCYTAAEHSNPQIDNITHNIMDKSNGMTNVFGWRDEILVGDVISWMKRFNSKLANGSSLLTALSYANSFSDYIDNSTIKNVAYYVGNSTHLRNNKNNKNINNITSENLNVITINPHKTVKFTKEEKNINNVIQLIEEELNKTINIQEYEINVFNINEEYNHYNIDFEYKIGEYYTNLGYTVIVEYGKVTEIIDNMSEEININAKKINESKIDLDRIKEIAKLQCLTNMQENSVNSIKESDIKKQRVKMYLDTKTGEKTLKIFTTYEKNGVIGVNVFEKSI